MSDDAKAARRLEALEEWFASAASSGYAVPSPADLASIAAAPVDWENRVESIEAGAWSHTINYVLNQIRFGVIPSEILRSLSDEYLRPRAATGSDAEAAMPASNSERDSVVAALVSWRQRRIDEDADGANLIKVTTLKNIVANGFSDPEVISKKLPGQAAGLAGEIAEIVMRMTVPPGGAGRKTDPLGNTPKPADVVEKNRVVGRRSRHGLLNLTHEDFCEYRYQTDNSEEAHAAPHPLRVTPIDGGVRLSYDALATESEKMVIYRVVASDGDRPRKPELGDLVGATTELQIDDRCDFGAAVRAYQVWCHVGVDQEDAVRTNPFLLAQGQEVCPVSDYQIHTGGGRISGEWQVFPGARRVRVFRIPADSSAKAEDPRYEICREDSNISGFADWSAEPGKVYIYRACVEVSVDGVTQLSRPTDHQVTVPVALEPIDDLSIAASTSQPGRIDLAFTEPAIGTVKVFWSNSKPRADVAREVGLSQSQLAMIPGFEDSNRIKGPTDKLGETKLQITGVAWPSDWSRVYVTPVTVYGDQVRVGVTRVETRPLPAVSHAEIHERYDTEMVTFGWPADAVSVLVYVGSTSMSVEDIVERNNPLDEISRSRYERDGGHIFERPLESKGCTVVLVPIDFSQGKAVHGQPMGVQYPGLHRIKYGLAVPEVSGSRLLTELHLINYQDIDSPIALTMVNRQDRLPLSPTDGKVVYFLPPDGGELTPQCLIQELKRGQYATGWRADWSRLRGWFRLFISSQVDGTRTYALADPPIPKLWLGFDVTSPGSPQ